MTDDRRERGQEMMRSVYGWDIPVVEGDFVELTVDHLFAEIWSREGLTIKERRLLLIGLMTALGLDDLLELQLRSALDLGEMDASQLREIVIFMSHYAGWPRGAKLNSLVEKLVGQT